MLQKRAHLSVNGPSSYSGGHSNREFYQDDAEHKRRKLIDQWGPNLG